MMGADGPEGVLDQYAGFQGASTSLQADYKRFAAADSLAEVYETKAQAAKARQTTLAAAARAAQQQAAAAADAAQGEAATIAAEKTRLVTELAQAQHISVSMARTRQAALEEIARKRAEERARQAALAAARAQARADAKARAAAAAPAASRAEGRRQGRAPGRRWLRWLRWRRVRPRARTRSCTGPRAGAEPAVAQRWGAAGDRLRQGPARGALPVGRDRPRLVGLLRPHHGGVGLGRPVPAALLGGAVRDQRAHLRRRPAPR